MGKIKRYLDIPDNDEASPTMAEELRDKLFALYSEITALQDYIEQEMNNGK
jgi:hypothetical protein